MSHEGAVGRLAEMLLGRVIGPDDSRYDEARAVWNGMVDRRPALVVRCAGAADVITCLDFARGHGLPVSVRGGGHGVAGKAIRDGALMVDLSSMRDVHVDPKARVARVGGGATWAATDHETQAFGLAVTGGVDSRTGVGGLTLGGGVGYLARAYGLTVDSLLSADVVLADGRSVTASADEHPDLYWALRGGGGGFGVVTEFEFRLHPLGPEVMTAQAFHSVEEARAALIFYRDYLAAAPEDVGCFALFVSVPPVAPFPEDRWGKTALAFVACHAGSLENGARDLAPLAEFGTPFVSAVVPMPYADLQRSFDASAPDGARFYWKAQYFDELPDAALETLAGGVDPLPGPYSTVFLEPLGGAVARIDPSATAFPHRRARFGLGIASGWADPAHDAAAIAWTRSLHEAMAPYSSGGVYVNYLDRDDEHRARAAFGANLTRLAQIRSVYDRDGVFSSHERPVPVG